MGWLTEGPTLHGQLYDIPSTGRVVATLLFVDFTDSRAGAGDAPVVAGGSWYVPGIGLIGHQVTNRDVSSVEML